ncbi:MAG: hypothetical protein V4787_10740 [Pseudomonadota bacterium]
MNLKTFLLAVVAFGAAAPAAAANCAAFFERKKITIVVPFKPGGGFDGYARALAPVLQQHTGARVSVANMPGANGAVGMRAIAAAPPDSLMLGVFDLRDLVAARLADETLPAVSDFTVLGSFGTVSGVWAAREGGVSLDAAAPLTVGLSTGIVPRVQLPAMLLGREVTIVRGFGGMTDRWLALLRGDVDIVDGSHDSIARLISGAPGTKSLLALSSGPIAAHPGTPHLAGQGGVVDQRTRQLDAATRRSRMDLAGLAADLSASERTVSVASKAQPALRACLEQSVAYAIHSDALRESAKQQKLALEPTRAADVKKKLAQIEAAVARNLPLLKRLAATSGAGS